MLDFARRELAVIGFEPFFHIWIWSHRRDGLWIDVAMTLGVLLADVSLKETSDGNTVADCRSIRASYILLDMLEIGALLKPRHIPVTIPEPIIDPRIIVPNRPQITLEVLHVHRIESDNRSIQSQIQLRHVLAKYERSTILVDQLFDFVEGGEDGDDVLIVGFLIGSKAGFVDSCVEIGLHPV